MLLMNNYTLILLIKLYSDLILFLKIEYLVRNRLLDEPENDITLKERIFLEVEES